MNFLSQLRIGRRLGLAFTLIVMLTVASAVFSQMRLQEIRAMSGELTGEQAERMSLAYRWRQNIALSSSRAATLAMMSDATLAATLVDKIKATTIETAGIQKRFEALETTAEGKSIVSALVAVRLRYIEQRDALNKAGEGGNSIAATIAKGQATTAFNALADEYLAASEKLVTYETKRAETDAAAINAAVMANSVVNIGCGVVCVLASIALGLLLTRSIVGPVKAAQRAADRIASGDLTGNCDASGTDETAQLTGSLGRMQDALARIVREIRSSTEQIQVCLLYTSPSPRDS